MRQKITEHRKSLPIASGASYFTTTLILASLFFPVETNSVCGCLNPVEKRLIEEVQKNDILIIVGETGSGKTTRKLLNKFFFSSTSWENKVTNLIEVDHMCLFFFCLMKNCLSSYTMLDSVGRQKW